MASYMYNPSQKVTELLSKFLEFDPESLEMGIWSGDLSLKNVHLKREALKPLLNRTSSKPTDPAGAALFGTPLPPALDDPTQKEPLRVKLVRGTVGHLRMQIPWKQLVWGQGAVRVEVSDVEIVLGLQSREETAREEAREREDHDEDDDNDDDRDDLPRDAKRSKRERRGSNGHSSSGSHRKRKKKDGRSRVYHKAYRDAKQRRLREAERKQLSKDSELAAWLEQLHQRQSIAKEAHRAEQKELGLVTSNSDSGRRRRVSAKYGGGASSHHSSTAAGAAANPPPPKEGKFDRYLRTVSSDFFWRMFAGVRGSISKARIVLLQDGVEVGCIVQSIEVVAGKDGIESLEIQQQHHHNIPPSSSNNSHNSNSQNNLPNQTVATGNSQSTSGEADTLPKPHPIPQSAYDDGEHIDKVLRQSGIGIFVRRETHKRQLTKIPSELRFSISVEADDYILRPVAELKIGLSFFYPHPPERRKKPPSAASSVAAATTHTATTASTVTHTHSSSTNPSVPTKSEDKGVAAAAASSIAATASGSVASSSMGTAGTKRRRGKRDKESPSRLSDRPSVQTLPPSNDSNTSDGDVGHTPSSWVSTQTYFSDPRVPLLPNLPLPNTTDMPRAHSDGPITSIRPVRSASTERRGNLRPTKSIGSATTSSSGGGTRSTSRLPPQTQSSGTAKERRGKLRRTKSTGSPNPERKVVRLADQIGTSYRSTVLTSGGVEPASSDEDATSDHLGTSFRSATDRRHPAQRLRTPLRGNSSSQLVTKTPLMRGSSMPRNMTRGNSASTLSAGGGLNTSLHNVAHQQPRSVAPATVAESYSPTVYPDAPETPCPRLQVRVGVDDVQVVFTNRHYELLNYLWCIVARMKNGRPDRTIRSVKVTEPGSELLELLQQRKSYQRGNSEKFGDRRAASQKNEAAGELGIGASFRSMNPYWWSSSTASEQDQSSEKSDSHQESSSSQLDEALEYIQGRRLKSARQEVVVQWWKYAIGAIRWEIRKRKHMTSVFHDMYISFDWKKQRHRRQEYINAYIAHKLQRNTSSGSSTSGSRFPPFSSLPSGHVSKTQREIEEKLAEIEDELPIEQILLYRSIARSMRVRGTTKMPTFVYELWGKEGLTSAEITRSKKLPRGGVGHHHPRSSGGSNTRNTSSRNPVKKFESSRTLNTSFESHGDSGDEREVNVGRGDGLLANVQNKFESTLKLRDKGGVLSHFAREAEEKSNDTNSVVHHPTDVSESLRGANQEFTQPTPMKGNSTSMRRPSKAAIEAGRFYASNASASGKKDYGTIGGGDMRSRADGRTIRSSKMGRSSQSRAGPNATDTLAPGMTVDQRMRLFFSFQIKKFNLIVVEEKSLYDLYPDMRGGEMVASSSNRLMNSDTSLQDDSSVNNLSDLSVLTDDERWFGDDGSDFDRIVEEEEEDFEDAIGRPQLKSTDFLSFGKPENPLLRLTISSLVTTSKGISGGGMQIGMSVGRIEATGDNDTHILSMGPLEPSVPIDEVDIDESTRHNTTKRMFGATRGSSRSLGTSTMISKEQQQVLDGIIFTKSPATPPHSAISLMFSKGGPTKTLQCDLSKIEVTANTAPAEKLLRFYSRPEIKRPEKLLNKTSRDVAREIMVKKMSNNPTKSLATITSAIRVHGIEVKVPFSFDDPSDSSEDSELDESFFLSHGSEGFPPKQKIQHRYSTVFELETLELYSGMAVDELIQSAAMIGDGKDTSTSESFGDSWGHGSSFCSSIQSQTLIRTLKMLNLAELTAAHDSFASNHVVVTMGGMECRIESPSAVVPELMDIPINVEVLMTSNQMSLLDTENPKQQIVVEVSPLHVILSKRRLEFLSATNNALTLGRLDDAKAVMKKKIRPDPPRIEILSQRIMSSIDFNCHKLRFELVKDKDISEASFLPQKMKELVMEETLSDFLSIVACFDFSLPNEEALSSAMQVCIGRLVGMGLNDDEAWSCTNQARINFLDDIAMMRQQQSDILDVMSEVMSKNALSSAKESNATTESESSSSGDEHSHGDEFSDDDTDNSANIVETTINSAVERTVSSFSPLLQTFFEDGNMDNKTFLFLDLPMGLSLSIINLFYDNHIASLVPSLVVTNKAGIELLTLVPNVKDEMSVTSANEKKKGILNNGIAFSRFNMDKNHGFGKGGLPMSVLASNKGAEEDLFFRERRRFDDVNIGELEFFFSASIFEEIIDETSVLLPKNSDQPDSTDGRVDNDGDSPQGSGSVSTSTVMMASCLSLLFTSDTLVPFCRLTLENICYKNALAMESLAVPDTPTFALVASVFALHNLSPEGQFYPDVLTLLSPEPSNQFPFQIRYFQSPDSWKFSNRLEIDFTSFRLFLVRQFINDLLHYFVYDQYGVGKLRKKYETIVQDVHGNGKPPLLYSVYIYDTSIICPRNSNSTDMVAFEVEDACIAVSYVPETFAMPTKSSPFWANPPPKKGQQSDRVSSGGLSTTSSFVSLSDYEDAEESYLSRETQGPISSHSKDLKRRLKINLDRIRVFTALSGDKMTQDLLHSSIFRFIHTIDGRAEDLKEVYKRDSTVEHSLRSENILQFNQCIQSWEEISTNPFSLEILFDSAPHTRLLVSCDDAFHPLSLDARLSQLCLLLSVWDSNMQELGTMFPVSTKEVFESARPPTIPDDFPDYCSKDFVSYLESIETSIRSEICCMFKKISFRCTFDEPGYFSTDPNCFQYFDNPDCDNEQKPGLILSFEDMVVHVLNNHLNVKRIGIGSSAIDLTDERKVSFFQSTLSSDPIPELPELSEKPIVWADLSWGLRENVRTLNSPLPQPVQCSVFMTPGWSLTNLGIQSANGTMHDLSWVWVLLDYFKSYYCNPAFGNVGFEAQKWSHRIKNALRRSVNEDVRQFEFQPGVNVDFRVWLGRPILCLPSDNYDPHSPSLVLSSETGLWYRYKSVKEFSSQEVASTDLNLSFANEYLPPEKFRRETNSGLSRTTGPLRPLIEGLSFGLRYDCNNEFNHKDVSVVIPLSGEKAPSLSLDGEELEIEPVQLAPPKVLKPFRQRTRLFGSKVCDITCIIEVFPLASATFMNFLTGPSEVNTRFSPDEDEGPPQTLSISAEFGDIRFFVIDPDLGVQLPIAVLSLASSSLSMSKFAIDQITEGLERGESQPADMQLILTNNLWIDYFKLGLTRSWEPLLEPFEFEVLYETSIERGQGYSISSDTPLHFNLSGALLSFLSETIDSFNNIVRDTFGEKDDKRKGFRGRESTMFKVSLEDEGGTHLKDILKGTDGSDMNVIHEIPKPLKAEDRVAFSLRNLTGQRIRIHQQSNSSTHGIQPVVVTYLNQGESSGLTFAATISVVKNLRIVEVPYPGFELSKYHEYQKQGSLNHAIDLQIPGCRWLQGVRVDSFGRKFQSLTPRSSQVMAKISNDWRLRNVMSLLTEVGPDNGGRLLSIRSIFEIKNNTTHPVNLVFHPDPRYKPDAKREGNRVDADVKNAITKTQESSQSEYAIIEPGSDFQLPTLLLESALEMEGSHLGSVWVRPDTANTKTLSFRDFSNPIESEVEEFDASFCSRPVQLAKIVHETSRIYQNGAGEDIEQSEARSGVQVSCATHSQNGKFRTPFCYAIEIIRSPIVKSKIHGVLSSDAKEGRIEKEKNKKKRKPVQSDLIHGPVAYSLAIHSPIVIVNLLPEGGRFELMHAIRKTVVWYADLEPGQQVPIHSLGLDVPLLLLVNLGFCRTPIGEGALVHHGGEAVNSKGMSPGLKSIGKAVTKGTKKIGKTLTTLAESPDKRAQERVAKVVSPKAKRGRRRRGNVKHNRSAAENGSLGLDIGHTETDRVGGKVHAIEGVTYSSADIADETTVVDSVGQRLTLRIENVRGGGGQRRISLYCPYWIVNTTEHALRYREEKEKRYVSGTVISPGKDGSMPVDGSNRQYRSRYELRSNRRSAFSSAPLIPSPPSMALHGRNFDDPPTNPETVFAGTHGALATSPGRCTLSPERISTLIDQDMPLKSLAEVAFMFNFFEDGTGSEKLMIQLYDGLRSIENKFPDYTSGWSTGFGLETVGFSQVIRIPCKDGRMLELSASVNVAPGFLSGYTKIVRFCPRYAIFNRLERPIRLWQDSSIARSLREDRSDATNELRGKGDSRKWRYGFEDNRHGEKISQYESMFGRHAILDDRFSQPCDQTQLTIPEGTAAHRSALYITSVGPSQLIPFFLPDTRADSQLRIDVGGPWNLSSSFSSNIPGEHVLPISRATDIRTLNHVSTRDAPKYKIILPPPQNEDTDWDGELGAYFETEYVSKNDRKILVKGTKRGKYAFNNTDIHIGDELLRINGISVIKMSFQEAMDTIKEKLLEIRSHQEKMKLKESGSAVKTSEILRRLTVGGRQNRSMNSSERGNPNRGLKRLSLGAKKKSYGSTELEASNVPSQLTLTFRTQEERLRKLRMKAIKARNAVNLSGKSDPEQADLVPIDALTVETKALHNTMFVILRDADKENPPFKIQNRSLKYILFYRQRYCEEHEWNVLLPGESRSYSWEEPMRSKKLTVRMVVDSHELPNASIQEKSSDGEPNSAANRKVDFEVDTEEVSNRAARLRQLLAYQYVDSEERGGFGPPTTIRLEEIGFRTALPAPSFKDGADHYSRYLNCEVDTDGGTRLLVVSDFGGEHDERQKMNLNLESLKKQISNEESRGVTLQSMRRALLYPVRTEDTEQNVDDELAENERDRVIENELRELVEDFPEGNSISRRCQVVVQVLEAVGLHSSDTDIVGNGNPYCEVFYKGRSRSKKHFLQKRKNKRKTYYVEKTSNPRWNDQFFVFDVPETAIEVNRGHSIQIVVREFRSIGQHPILGQASMHFASIRNQLELVGWWPLVGKYRNADIFEDKLSDSGRGSIKLRAQWIYTLPAMIDYYILLSQRRLLALTKTERGMQEQLKSAEESFQRKREAVNRLPGGRIAKLVKLQKRNYPNRDANLKRELIKKERRSKTKSKPLSPLNTNFLQLKDALKRTRKESMDALNIQTAESKIKRQLELDEIKNDLNIEELSRNLARNLRLPSTSNLSVEKDNIRGMLPITAANARDARDRTKSLGDYFAQQRSSIRARRNGTEWNPNQHISHRKLSLELDDPFIVEALMESMKTESSNHQDSNVLSRQTLPTISQTKSSDTCISDLISVGTDTHEQARRNNDIARLNALGFVFHESGSHFHEEHLPNHFRRLLFASSLDRSKSQLHYCRKFFVGTSSSIRKFKNWQAAQTLLWDSDVNVSHTENSFLVKLNDGISHRKSAIETDSMNASKSIIAQKLSVPEEAPGVTVERSRYRIETMHLSRTQFDRSCRRILGCVLNPGGWLTIRPIVAMNLPDSYIGMYVKASHGSEEQVSETVDAKVSPRWSSVFPGSSSASKVKGKRRSSIVQKPDTISAGGFKFSDNDLHLHVEPQQTGGSIRLSVVAERHKTTTELGVVNIPLGAAIAACIDSAQDMEKSGLSFQNRIPMYTRWFPLTEPKLTVPVAGDMGLSSRPQENEQMRDTVFQYAPCIQLSLMWWPYDQNDDGNKDRADVESKMETQIERGSSIVSQITRIPKIQSYFNADISAISFALIDSVRAVELLNLSLREIDAKYAVTRTKTRIGLVIGWIQMDQQGPKMKESVVFAPTPTEHLQPTLQFLALKDNLRTKSNIVSYEYVGVALQEMDLTVEEPSVYKLWDFFMSVMARKRIKKRAAKGQQHAAVVSRNANVFNSFEPEESNPPLFSILQSAGNRDSLAQKKMYVEQLILGLVKINLSYVKGKKQIFEVSETGRNAAIQNFTIVTGGGQDVDIDIDETTKELSEVFTRWSQLTSDEDSLWESSGAQNNLPNIIAAVFPSVSDAPIRLQGKLVEHVFESAIEIASSLKNYYTNETLKQVYKIIGSLDLVGNPIILLSSFMSGVKDLVAIPTAAFMKSPADVKQVGIGVGKGTVSFLSHSASGLFGWTARLFSQVGQFTAFFSLDSEYRQWHRDRIVNETTNLERVWKRRGMPKVQEMVLRPVADVVLGFTLGISGVVMAPYRGARKSGVKGFVVGTGIGVAGLVTKPIVGVFDAMTHGSQNFHDIAKTVNFLERRYQPVLKLRLPYVFGPMKILTPFDPISARSVYLLGLFPPKIKAKDKQEKARELHVHSEVLNMEPGVETYAIATTIRVILIKLRRDTGNSLAPIFGWEVELSNSASNSSQISDHGHNGVALTITKRVDSTIPVPGKIGRKMSEMTAKTKKTSIVSEADEEDEEIVDLGENFHSTRGKPLRESVSAGVTKKGNTTLEWYTVLAEYQQRKPLTRLHNAISCILGDYNAVISDDRAQSQVIGTTSFGIYNFEKGLPDGRAAKVSNTKIVASLENLYWVETNLVHRLGNISSPDRKQRALNRVRNSWDFSNDMKASENVGGPDWLIVARARAMSIHNRQKEYEDDSSSDQLRQGRRFFADDQSGHRSISSGPYGASRQSSISGLQSFEVVNLSSSNRRNSITGSLSTVDRERERVHNISSIGAPQDGISHGPPVISTEPNPLAPNAVDNIEINQGMNTIEPDFYSPINGMMTDAGDVEVHDDNRHPPPIPSLTVTRLPTNREEISPRSASRTITATETFDSSRISRLEGVMEQLLILNAANVQREAAAASEIPTARSELSHARELADTLKQELTDIREKMEERAREDEALRQEIGLLRGQLAEKRSVGAAAGLEAGIPRTAAGTTTNSHQRKPPPIHTQFLKTNRKIRGLFQNRKKPKHQREPQPPPGNRIHRNEDVNSSDVLIPLSDVNSNNPPLGLDTDDEQSGDQRFLS